MQLPFGVPTVSFANILSPESLNSPTVQTIIVGIFLFVLLILIGLSRRILAKSSLQGIWAGFLMGIMAISLLLGGFLYLLKQINSEAGIFVPDNIKQIVNSSQNSFTQVLGVKTERNVPTAQSVILDYELLSNLDAKLVQTQVCEPAEGIIE